MAIPGDRSFHTNVLVTKMLFLKADYNSDQEVLSWMMMRYEPQWFCICSCLMSTHGLPIETGSVTNSDVTLPQYHKHIRKRGSPLRSLGCSSFPEKQGTLHHVFWIASYSLTSDVGEIWSRFFLWKLCQSQKESQPAWCGWWKALQSPITISRWSSMSLLHLAASRKTSSS